jgi:hypothetical protein
MTTNKCELSLKAKYNTLSPTMLTSYDSKSLVISLGLKNVKKRVKQSHYRPGQALRVPGG